VTDQRYPPRGPGRPGNPDRQRPAPRPAQRPGGSGWQILDAFDAAADTESELPPWAVPTGIAPVRAPRRPARGSWPGQAGQREPADRPGHREAAGQFAHAAQPEVAEQGGPAWPGAQAGGGPPRPARHAPAAEHDPQEPGSEPGQRRRAGRLRLPGRSRVAAARRRRSRRRLLTWGAAAIVIVVIAAVIVILNQPAPVRSRFVTTLQKGELPAVPDACRAVSTVTLSQYLPGDIRRIQPFASALKSQCTYTVDARPVFRVLNASMQAYQPAGYIVAGNGSATANAVYSFGQQRDLLLRPPKRSPQPPATITPLTGLGQQAFSAVQQFHGSILTDWVTVVVRYRNVLITASLEAQASGGFGPVSLAELRTGAMTVARELLAAAAAARTAS
jgi:hypothetical protein